MVFTIMDILAVATPWLSGGVDGFVNFQPLVRTHADKDDRINPYWKLTLVFKCLTDNIMLDDFKTELQKLGNSTRMLGSDDSNPAHNGGETQLDGDSTKLSTFHVHAEAPYAINNYTTDPDLRTT